MNQKTAQMCSRASFKEKGEPENSADAFASIIQGEGRTRKQHGRVRKRRSRRRANQKKQHRHVHERALAEHLGREGGGGCSTSACTRV